MKGLSRLGHHVTLSMICVMEEITENLTRNKEPIWNGLVHTGLNEKMLSSKLFHFKNGTRFQRDYDNYHSTSVIEKDVAINIGEKDSIKAFVNNVRQRSKNSSFSNPCMIDKYFKKKNSIQDEKLQEHNLSLDEWIRRSYGTTKINKQAKIKAFVDWMVDSSLDDKGPPDQDNDPYNRSFERFKKEFEGEVQQLLVEYGHKIGRKGHILDDIWEKCEKTYNGKPSFWHENELEAMEVHGCQIDGVKYDPPEIKMETFKEKKCVECNSRHTGECTLEARRCFRCGNKGHVGQDCTSKEPICYSCKEMGHISTNCPNKKLGSTSGTNTRKDDLPRSKARAFHVTAEEEKVDNESGGANETYAMYANRA
ncbi:zinc finger, CCHC-type, Retrotransposon gag domain protein [Artemisia annua]|uniref:Zinc finger, CCHC-type, Retrotransposon gag domain protein n=1 Tax=Artemisia annua TaxID=35608 RepID=A0A2U1LI73_ARTAN|nr:zinc finger, CCHC-type, Retrotransposon gag domain protein [Artemisia annua]